MIGGKPIWEVISTLNNSVCARCPTRSAAELAKKMLESDQIDPPKYTVRQKRLFSERLLRRIIDQGIRNVELTYTKDNYASKVIELDRVITLLAYSGTGTEVFIRENYNSLTIAINSVIADGDEAAVKFAVSVWENHPDFDEHMSGIMEWRLSTEVQYRNFHISNRLLRDKANASSAA